MSPSANAAAVGLLDDVTLDFYRDAMALMDAGGLDAWADAGFPVEEIVIE